LLQTQTVSSVIVGIVISLRTSSAGSRIAMPCRRADSAPPSVIPT
jgi:hypothetical protein